MSQYPDSLDKTEIDYAYSNFLIPAHLITITEFSKKQFNYPITCEVIRNWHKRATQQKESIVTQKTEEPASKVATPVTLLDMLFEAMLLAEHPASDEAKPDFSQRSILADYFEDNQESIKADCLRWCVTEQKRCYQSGGNTPAAWFNLDARQEGLGDPESDISKTLWEALPIAGEAEDTGGKKTANHILYPTARDAEEALMVAWAKVYGKGNG